MRDNIITGSRGFIGSHLRERLDHEDTLCIPHEDLVGFPAKFAAKRFFYLASYGTIHGQNDWHEMVASNVIVPIGAYADWSGGDDGKFIFVSTSSVNLPYQTTYSRCKRAAEEALLAANDPRITIVRPYSITGVGDLKERLIPRLIHAAFTGETIPFYPEGVHDWVDVEDFVDGLLMATQIRPSILELGRGVKITNAEVLVMVEVASKKKINTTPMPGRPYDNCDWCCKDSVARNYGWMPKKPLSKSIREMIEDYKAKNAL